MAEKIGSMKPKPIEDFKVGPYDKITEAQFDRWQGVLLSNVRKHDKWAPLIAKQWNKKSTVNRGIVNNDAQGQTPAVQAGHIDSLLQYISHYGPAVLQREIQSRCLSLDNVWKLIRTWAGIKSTGITHQAYYQAKKSYDPTTISYTDFYYKLMNAKEDCLLRANGEVKYEGEIPQADEEFTACNKSDVVLDWLDCVGGAALVDHVFRVFAKDLCNETLHDIRQRIIDNIETLIMEAENTAEARNVKISRASLPTESEIPINKIFFPRGQGGRSRGRLPPQSHPNNPFPRRDQAPPPSRASSAHRSRQARPLHPGAPCEYCTARGLPQARSHSIGDCYQLANLKKKVSIKAATVNQDSDQNTYKEEEDDEENYTYPAYSYEFDDDEEDDSSPYFNKQTKHYPAVSSNDPDELAIKPPVRVEAPSIEVRTAKIRQTSSIPSEMIKINKVNIYDSPILAATATNNKTIYLVLDTGAMASLITKKKADELNLQIHKTTHKAVQVDGETNLVVLGEVHTEFNRGPIKLVFSALVVNRMGTPILAGTNFHVENDISSRMATNSIIIAGIHTFQSTAPAILNMDQFDTRQRLVHVPNKIDIVPGEMITFSVPSGFPSECEVAVEPNLAQVRAFFTPKIVQVRDSKFTIENEGPEVLQVKKNCQAVTIRMTGDAKQVHHLGKDLLPTPIIPKTTKQMLDEFDVSNIPASRRKSVLDVVEKYSEVFQNDLPGYNNSFGIVYANFEWASKARPTPQKLRAPAYGSHGAMLFNIKCKQLVEKGVLVNPMEHGIQPIIVNNAWLVKKDGTIPFNDCTENDVRLVVGFDPVNKFLQDPPGKVTTKEAIYTNLAKWKYMGEADFTDCYHQLKFRMDTPGDKKKLAYLCIKTAFGTLAFTRAPMGLLGMDVFQDELTDALFGDLVLAGKVCKIADNIYFGGDTLDEMLSVFEELVKRCHKANLRFKIKKIRLNIKSADILGLHWQQGTLTPSRHKLDPLAHCDRPKTVKGLRSFLGGVRFNEICLNGAKLAAATQPLDQEIPSSRPGKEIINWTTQLIQSFQSIQTILKNPLTVAVPREGDTLLLAMDACSSIPAGGSKLIIQRPGVPGYLLSFNFGCRLPKSLKSKLSPCEFEAFVLNKSLQRAEYFIRVTRNPGICLIDSKAVVQAKNRLDAGKFSTSRRLQDLLANISAKRMTVQHISAKIPSPLLQLVDFASRNPVKCNIKECTICEELENSDTTFLGGVSVGRVSAEEATLATVASWRDIQQSCPDLRRVHALLTSGRKLASKEKKCSDIRTYLRNCTVNNKGLLVVLKSIPFQSRPTEAIVIPRAYAFTFSKALHVQFDHPNKTQMILKFKRQYFMLDEKKILDRVHDTCEYPCRAKLRLPKEVMEYNTETKPDTLASYFNADVMEESGQKILLLRENLTSMTATTFIKSQTKHELRDSLLLLALRLRLQKPLTIRTDPHPSFAGLHGDPYLEKVGISLEIGHAKNVNKNAVAEKGIRELREEIVKIHPKGGPITETTLALATDNLNSMIRYLGRSAKELYYSRDQVSGENLEIVDKVISEKQYNARKASHNSSAKYSARNGKKVVLPNVKVGEMIYIKSDANKSKARDPYVVQTIDKDKSEVVVQKFPIKKRHPLTVKLQNIYPAVTNDYDETTNVVEEDQYKDIDKEVPERVPRLQSHRRHTTAPHPGYRPSLQWRQTGSSESSSEDEWEEDTGAVLIDDNVPIFEAEDHEEERELSEPESEEEPNLLSSPASSPPPSPPAAGASPGQRPPSPAPTAPARRRHILLQPKAKERNYLKMRNLPRNKLVLQRKLRLNKKYLLQQHFWGVLRGEDENINIDETDFFLPGEDVPINTDSDQGGTDTTPEEDADDEDDDSSEEEEEEETNSDSNKLN